MLFATKLEYCIRLVKENDKKKHIYTVQYTCSWLVLPGFYGGDQLVSQLRKPKLVASSCLQFVWMVDSGVSYFPLELNLIVSS